MKRAMWLAVLTAAIWGLPRLSHPAVDLGKLEPVETVRITAGPEGVTVETDQGDTGTGETLESALEDLYQGAGCHLFLDTTGKILITGTPDLGDIVDTFRPSAVICMAQGELDLAEATKYLGAHGPELTLNKLRAGYDNWQILTIEDGRGSLEYPG